MSKIINENFNLRMILSFIHMNILLITCGMSSTRLHKKKIIVFPDKCITREERITWLSVGGGGGQSSPTEYKG